MKNSVHRFITISLIETCGFPSDDQLEGLATELQKGKSVIVRNVLPRSYCRDIVEYLSRLRTGTIPTYEPLTNKTPNHFRINHNDSRASVSGYFEQFNFFMHNQDIMDLFKEIGHVFRLKDKLSHLMSGRKTQYDSMNPPKGYISRIGFQFYPKGKGYLSEHCDYAGDNQLIVPTIILSKRGQDYSTGGFYYRTEDGLIIDPEPYIDIGDIILFNPRLAHGVERISYDSTYNWKSCEGRWMAFATTTKTT